MAFAGPNRYGVPVIAPAGMQRDLPPFQTFEQTAAPAPNAPALVEMLTAAVEATGAGIAVADARHADLPVVYCNRAFLEMTGYDADEVLGRSLRFLEGPDTSPETAEELRRAHTTGQAAAVEILNYRKDGTPFWNAVSLQPMAGPDGRLRWLVASCTDVTRRHQSERELRDAQDQLTKLAAETFALAEDLDRAREEAEEARIAAENASRAKSRFLAMMSHELRTPMTAVIGMGDLLMGTPLSDEQKTFVKTLRSSADTLLTILNDVLDFSKIEAGQLALEEIDFSLPRLVDDVVQLFLVRAAAKGLALSASIADDTPRHVRGDPTRLRQVLFNLVSNAIKFTERGGVEIAVWMADAEADGDGMILRFEVEDTGIGMSEEQRVRLFGAFVQADASTNRKYGGTGLGLAICKRLVEAMGGEITVTTDPGSGSTFRFSVRLRRALGAPSADTAWEPPQRAPGENPSPPPTAAAAASGAGASLVPAIDPAPVSPVSLSLLLAEDNEINRMLIAAMLERIGHRVEAVADGRAAVDAVQAGSFDAILLDMEMPVMDGRAATRAIRRMAEPLSTIPIIGISADALPEHRESHLAAGLDAYLTKPVDWEQLNSVIVDLASRPRDGRAGQAATAVTPMPTADRDGFARLALVDRIKLAELRLALGADSLGSMLRLLPETAMRELTAIRSALMGNRPRDLKQAAHTLSGLAANFGTPRVAAIAKAINDQYHDAERVAALLPLLETAVADTSRLVDDPEIMPQSGP